MRAFINIKRIFVFLYVMVIIALLLVPSLKYDFKYAQVVMLSLPLIAIAFIEGKTFRKALLINVILLFVTFMSYYVINVRGNLGQAQGLLVTMYLFTLPYLICQYLIDIKDTVLMKWICIATCGILAYIMIVTFREYAYDPTISRKLASSVIDPYIISQIKKNIGGFGFCYCLGMFAPYLTSVIGRVKGKQKFVAMASLLFILVFSVFSQYTTLILLSVISIFYVILTQGKMSVKKVITLVLFIVITLSFRKILLFLANNVGLSTLSNHFYSLYYILGGEEDFGRWSLYKANFILFLQNPIFGADLTVHYNEYLVDHAHSTAFSRMSGGGIIGFGGFVGFIASAWYYLTKKSSMRYLIPVFVVYILLSILNPVTPEISITAFLIIPLIEYQFINKEEQLYV